MRIKRLETFSTRYIAFVRATLEDGSIGWGQLSTYNSDITADVFHRQAAPWVLGEAAWPIDPLIDRIEEKEHKFPGAYLKRAMAGLDTALWDLESKRQEKPVVTLLGGKPRPAARLCLLHAARHHAGGRGGALRRASRPLRLRCLQVPGRGGIRP